MLSHVYIIHVIIFILYVYIIHVIISHVMTCFFIHVITCLSHVTCVMARYDHNKTGLKNSEISSEPALKKQL